MVDWLEVLMRQDFFNAYEMKPKTYYQLRVDEEAAIVEAQVRLLQSFLKPSISSDPGDEVESSHILSWV